MFGSVAKKSRKETLKMQYTAVEVGSVMPKSVEQAQQISS